MLTILIISNTYFQTVRLISILQSVLWCKVIYQFTDSSVRQCRFTSIPPEFLARFTFLNSNQQLKQVFPTDPLTLNDYSTCEILHQEKCYWLDQFHERVGGGGRIITIDSPRSPFRRWKERKARTAVNSDNLLTFPSIMMTKCNKASNTRITQHGQAFA
jgi:hypothetical protein